MNLVGCKIERDSSKTRIMVRAARATYKRDALNLNFT